MTISSDSRYSLTTGTGIDYGYEFNVATNGVLGHTVIIGAYGGSPFETHVMTTGTKIIKLCKNILFIYNLIKRLEAIMVHLKAKNSQMDFVIAKILFIFSILLFLIVVVSISKSKTAWQDIILFLVVNIFFIIITFLVYRSAHYRIVNYLELNNNTVVFKCKRKRYVFNADNFQIFLDEKINGLNLLIFIEKDSNLLTKNKKTPRSLSSEIIVFLFKWKFNIKKEDISKIKDYLEKHNQQIQRW